jgi:hypothetical protein
MWLGVAAPGIAEPELGSGRVAMRWVERAVAGLVLVSSSHFQTLQASDSEVVLMVVGVQPEWDFHWQRQQQRDTAVFGFAAAVLALAVVAAILLLVARVHELPSLPSF